VTDCVTLLVKSSVPRVQLVLVIEPAVESIVVVPEAVQLQLGEVLKLVFHCVASTFTDGGTATLVQLWQTAATQVAPPVHAFVQLPQWLLSVCSFTQAPLQRL
jgi:hypothetical protein